MDRVSHLQQDTATKILELQDVPTEVILQNLTRVLSSIFFDIDERHTRYLVLKRDFDTGLVDHKKVDAFF
jgi:hypothetical protein